MNEPSFPPRLSETEGDGLLREIVRAAKDEAMSQGHVARSLAAFEASELATGATPFTASASRLRWSLHAVLGTSLAIACALGLGWRSHRSVEAQAIPAPAAVPTAAATAPADEQVTVMRIEDLPTAVEVPPAAPTAPNRAAAPSSPPISTTSAASGFHEELALVESARAALERGDANECLRALDRHDTRFHDGVFGDEVLVMRIEALIAKRDTVRARKLAASFLATRPDSTYASHVRSLLSTAP